MTTTPLSRRLLAAALATVALSGLAGCGDTQQPQEPQEPGRHTLPESEAAEYPTVHIAAVQVPTDDADGYVLLRNNWDQRADIGGWALVGRSNRRIPIPPSTFVEPNGQLRVHLGTGDSDADDLYTRSGEEILEWDRLKLVDAAGKTVARFTYGRD